MYANFVAFDEYKQGEIIWQSMGRPQVNMMVLMVMMMSADRRGKSVPKRGRARRRSNRASVAGRRRSDTERQLCRLHGSQRSTPGRRQRLDGTCGTTDGEDQLRVRRGGAASRHQ